MAKATKENKKKQGVVESKKTSKKEPKNVTTKDAKNEKKKVTKNTSKKVTKKKEDNIFKKAIQFLKNVKKEMGKVRWPNKQEMIKYAGATLAFIVFFACFFLLTDGIIWALKQVMR